MIALIGNSFTLPLRAVIVAACGTLSFVVTVPEVFGLDTSPDMLMPGSKDGRIL